MKYEQNMLDNKKKASEIVVSIVTIVLSLVIICAIVIITVSTVKSNNKYKSGDLSSEMQRIEDAIKMVQEKYIEDVDTDKLIEGAISGIAKATDDPYTRYMDQKELDDMLSTGGTEEYGGLGVHITYDSKTGGILVIGIMPNGPAEEADIKAGDVIIAVENTLVTSDTYKDCVDALKGEEGTSVNLILNRDGKNIAKQVTRKKIKANNVESKILDGNIGYIKIWSFDTGIYEQFKAEYDKLKKNNINGLVIDVRNNPGGLVADTIKILQLMMPKCDLLKIVYKDSSEKVYKCDGKNEINIPLVVLTNSRSASASEILASAIKDSNKGIIIGNKTYGKGVIQEVEQLDGNGALSITVAKYYTASGIEIHKNGIEPNISVDLPDDVKNDSMIILDKDTQLQRAIKYIKEGK